MSELEIRIDGDVVVPADGWRLEWIDRVHGIARLVSPGGAVTVLAEGQGSDFIVTLRGRRIPVTARTWRERVLAAAERAAQASGGPVSVKATLPGLVVAVAVAVDDEVEEGAPLLTLEAMKMQNEVRAPRAGRVLEVAVSPGEPVATGALLLRLE